MPIYSKTENGWKLVTRMWEKRTTGWVLINPLYIKKSATEWEAIPFGTMLASTVVSPNGTTLRTGSAVTVTVSAINSSGFTDSGAGTQIQIATDTEFANIVSSYDGTYTTTWTSSVLSSAGQYYVRIRHKGTVLGWGPWSATYYFSMVAAIGQVGFTSSTTWTAPYSGTFTIFVCGGGGGAGGASFSGTQNSSPGRGGNAGGDSQVSTVSGTYVNVFASGGAGGGSGSVTNWGEFLGGMDGANSTWYTGGKGGTKDYAAGKDGGGGTGSSPYGMGGTRNNWGRYLGNGGNGGTASSTIHIAQGTILQIIVGGGGSQGEERLNANASTGGVVYITG